MYLVQVHDIAFTRAGSGRDLFASVGSDGSVRLFDLRYVLVGVANCLFECSCFIIGCLFVCLVFSGCDFMFHVTVYVLYTYMYSCRFTHVLIKKKFL